MIQCMMTSAIEVRRQVRRGEVQRDQLDDAGGALTEVLKHPCGVSQSNRQVALRVGVDEGTVRKWRERLATEIP
jgi:hypothetical protein